MATTKDKPYPRFCAECGTESVVSTQIAYNAEVKHDGKLHEFTISNLTIDKCQSCREEFFTMDSDREISRGLRIYLCFLQPEEIRKKIQQFGLTQAEFAVRLGVAKETVSRWITGHTIQNRAMDNLMRLFFGLSEVREVLTESGPIEGLGIISRTTVRQAASCDSQADAWISKREFSISTLNRRNAFKLSGC
jgi:putative zinc finger/helix-turn-helix YgiT family protein